MDIIFKSDFITSFLLFPATTLSFAFVFDLKRRKKRVI